MVLRFGSSLTGIGNNPESRFGRSDVRIRAGEPIAVEPRHGIRDLAFLLRRLGIRDFLACLVGACARARLGGVAAKWLKVYAPILAVWNGECSRSIWSPISDFRHCDIRTNLMIELYCNPVRMNRTLGYVTPVRHFFQRGGNSDVGSVRGEWW